METGSFAASTSLASATRSGPSVTCDSSCAAQSTPLDVSSTTHSATLTRSSGVGASASADCDDSLSNESAVSGGVWAQVTAMTAPAIQAAGEAPVTPIAPPTADPWSPDLFFAADGEDELGGLGGGETSAGGVEALSIAGAGVRASAAQHPGGAHASPANPTAATLGSPMFSHGLRAIGASIFGNSLGMSLGVGSGMGLGSSLGSSLQLLSGAAGLGASLASNYGGGAAAARPAAPAPSTSAAATVTGQPQPGMSLDQSFTDGLMQVLASVQLSAAPGRQGRGQPQGQGASRAEPGGIFGDLGSLPLAPASQQQGRHNPSGPLTNAAAGTGAGRSASGCDTAALGRSIGLGDSLGSSMRLGLGMGMGMSLADGAGSGSGSAADDLGSSFFAALPRSRPVSSSGASATTQTQPGAPSRGRSAPSLLVDDDDLEPDASGHILQPLGLEPEPDAGGTITRTRMLPAGAGGRSTPASVGASDGSLSLRPHSASAASLSPMPLLGWGLNAARSRAGAANGSSGTSSQAGGAAAAAAAHSSGGGSYHGTPCSIPPSPSDDLAEALAATDIGSFAPQPSTELCIKPSPRAFSAAAAAGNAGVLHTGRPWPQCPPSRPARTLLREPSRAAYAHSLEVEHSRLMPGVHTVASFPLAPPDWQAAAERGGSAGASAPASRPPPVPLSKALLRYDGLLVVGTQARDVSIIPSASAAGLRPGGAAAGGLPEPHRNHICVAWLSEQCKLPWRAADGSASGAGTGGGGPVKIRRPLAAPPSISAPLSPLWIPVQPLATQLAARGCSLRAHGAGAASTSRSDSGVGGSRDPLANTFARILGSRSGVSLQPVDEYVRDATWMDEAGGCALLAMGRYTALLMLPPIQSAAAAGDDAASAGMSVDADARADAPTAIRAELVPLLLHPRAAAGEIDIEAALPFASEIRSIAVAPQAASVGGGGSTRRLAAVAVTNRLFAACDFTGTVIVASAELLAPGSPLKLPYALAVHCRFSLPGAASVSFHPSKSGVLAVTSDTGAVSLLDVTSRRVLQRARLPLPALFSGAVATNGALLVGTGTGHVVVCEPAAGVRLGQQTSSTAGAGAGSASAGGSVSGMVGPCTAVGAGAFTDTVVAEIGDVAIAHRCPVPPTRASAPQGARAALAAASGRPPMGAAARPTDHSCVLLSGSGGWSLYEADLLDPSAPQPSFHMRACGFVNKPPAAPAFPPMALPGAPVLIAVQPNEPTTDITAPTSPIVVNGKRLRGAAAAAAAASRGAAAKASAAVVDVTGLASANEYFVNATCSATFVLARPSEHPAGAALGAGQRPPQQKRHGMTHADVTKAVAAAAAAAAGLPAPLDAGVSGPEPGRFVAVTNSYGHVQVFDTWSGLGAKTPSIRELRPLPAIAKELNDPAVRVRPPKVARTAEPAATAAPALSMAAQAQAAEAAAALSLLACSPAPAVASFGHAALVAMQPLPLPPPAHGSGSAMPSPPAALASRFSSIGSTTMHAAAEAAARPSAAVTNNLTMDADDEAAGAMIVAAAKNPMSPAAAVASATSAAVDAAAAAAAIKSSARLRIRQDGAGGRVSYQDGEADEVHALTGKPCSKGKGKGSASARRKHAAATGSSIDAAPAAAAIVGAAAAAVEPPADTFLPMQLFHAAAPAVPTARLAPVGRQPPLLGKSAGLPMPSRQVAPTAVPPIAASTGAAAASGAPVNGLAAQLLASNAMLHALAAVQTTARMQASLMAGLHGAVPAPAAPALLPGATGGTSAGGFASVFLSTAQTAAPVIVATRMPAVPSVEQQRADFLAALAASSATVAAASAAALHTGRGKASRSGAKEGGMRTDGSDDDDL